MKLHIVQNETEIIATKMLTISRNNLLPNCASYVMWYYVNEQLGYLTVKLGKQ